MPPQQDISSGELVALTILPAFVLGLIATFAAFVVFKQPWENIQESNVLALVTQSGIAVLGLWVIVVLMFEDVITSDVDVPIISAIVGLAAGKTWNVSTK